MIRSTSPVRKRSGTGPLSFAGTPAHSVPGATFSLGYDRTCCNDAALAYHAVVHNDCTHSYQDIVSYSTAVNYSVVPYAHIITYDGRKFLISAVYSCIVLHIDLVSHSYGIHICADDATIPKATAFTAGEVPNYGCVFSDE